MSKSKKVGKELVWRKSPWSIVRSANSRRFTALGSTKRTDDGLFCARYFGPDYATSTGCKFR